MYKSDNQLIFEAYQSQILCEGNSEAVEAALLPRGLMKIALPIAMLLTPSNNETKRSYPDAVPYHQLDIIGMERLAERVGGIGNAMKLAQISKVKDSPAELAQLLKDKEIEQLYNKHFISLSDRLALLNGQAPTTSTPDATTTSSDNILETVLIIVAGFLGAALGGIGLYKLKQWFNSSRDIKEMKQKVDHPDLLQALAEVDKLPISLSTKRDVVRKCIKNYTKLQQFTPPTTLSEGIIANIGKALSISGVSTAITYGMRLIGTAIGMPGVCTLLGAVMSGASVILMREIFNKYDNVEDMQNATDNQNLKAVFKMVNDLPISDAEKMNTLQKCIKSCEVMEQGIQQAQTA